MPLSIYIDIYNSYSSYNTCRSVCITYYIVFLPHCMDSLMTGVLLIHIRQWLISTIPTKMVDTSDRNYCFVFKLLFNSLVDVT